MFVKVHATWDTLCKYAEQMNIRMPFRYMEIISANFQVLKQLVTYYCNCLFQEKMLLHWLEEQNPWQVRKFNIFGMFWFGFKCFLQKVLKNLESLIKCSEMKTDYRLKFEFPNFISFHYWKD